jgi:hypothetical protein
MTSDLPAGIAILDPPACWQLLGQEIRISCRSVAGLVPALALAGRAGLEDLADRHLSVSGGAGANRLPPSRRGAVQVCGGHVRALTERRAGVISNQVASTARRTTGCFGSYALRCSLNQSTASRLVCAAASR